ncbi:MAG: hypothetical protein LIR50_21335 [Bacillota bacterium]|nr:hypothetical protein [Bacillota bacterium]
MAESVKMKFEWDDLKDPELVCPCDHCGAIELWPCCDDGATTSACNHCEFNIISYMMKREDFYDEDMKVVDENEDE